MNNANKLNCKDVGEVKNVNGGSRLYLKSGAG